MKKAPNQQIHGLGRVGLPACALALCLMASAALAQQAGITVRNFSWLAGKWKNTERNSFEFWSFNADSSVLSGYSFSMKDGDTLITEKLRLVCEGPTCYYIADVPDNGRPIRFAMMQHSPNSFRTENQQHDYPKYIEYRLEGPGKLRAEVGDAGRKQVFNFERQEPY